MKPSLHAGPTAGPAFVPAKATRDEVRTLAQRLHLEYLDHEALAALTPDLELLPLVRAQGCSAFIARQAEEPGCCIVLADPYDSELELRLQRLAPPPVRWALACQDDIKALLGRLEAEAKAVEQTGLHPAGIDAGARGDREIVAGTGLDILNLASATEASSPTVRLLSSVLLDALRMGASDVHLESMQQGLVVKLRVDGMLEELTRVSQTALAEQTISRLKVLAELDIAERRVPQDGSFRLHARGRDIDLRVSIMPSVHGEDAVIRILDKQAMVQAQGRLSLAGLGFDAGEQLALQRMVRSSHGMVLVTGPTGSGKTTTLYAVLTGLLSGREKVITIEDPVEYQLPGVLQIPVNDRKGLSFARGLRSILRHDPDIIMVGEIRDPETAEIAVQSALTGHLVLTTVHASNAFDVFGRFTHMGVDPYALASALNGVWAQRLLRLNCPRCSRPDTESAEAQELLGLSSEDVRSMRLMRGAGCGECRGTGYRGRRAITEILPLSDALRDLLVQRASLQEMKRMARSAGSRSLRDAGLALVRDGQTTLEEVCRVALDAS